MNKLTKTNKTSKTDTSSKIYYFFSGYSTNIIKQLKYDDVALYSITARYIADKMTTLIFKLPNINKKSIIIDCTACIGGNTISFARKFNNIISIELDNIRYKYLVHNLNVFKINNSSTYTPKHILYPHVTTYNANCLDVIYKFNDICTILFFDMPWGGPLYKDEKKIMLYLDKISIIDIIKMNLRGQLQQNKIIPYLIFKTPTNIDINAIKNIHEIYKIVEYNKMLLLILMF